jgi:hypothetical protein
VTDLGESEEALRQGDDILHLLNIVDAVLDSLGVLRPCTVQNTLDLLNLALRPVTVWLASRL